MSSAEKELEKRLSSLPDADPDSTWCMMFSLTHRGLVDEALEMLDDNPYATTDMVITFEEIYCGDIEALDGNGARMAVNPKRLRLTAGMRGILAEMKGKTFKSYLYEPAYNDSKMADCNVRVNLGQHAVDLNCYGFAFEVAGDAIELGAMHCERMSLRDDFRPWSDVSCRIFAVGERITGVELATDHVEVIRAGDACALDIDVAVSLRTAHAVYTFARKSWTSTDICVSVSNDVALPYELDGCDARWLGFPEGSGVRIGDASRTVTRLA